MKPFFFRPTRDTLLVSLAFCLLGVLLSTQAISAAAAIASKRVLVVHSFGSAAPPFTTHSIAFETELTERIGERVDLDEVSLDDARYADPETQEALVEYMQKRQAKWQPDLVVPIGSPAGVFVARHRDRLFPDTPILYTGLDRRRLPADALQKNAAFVGENFILPHFVEDILQISPTTTNIVVVIGASPLEQFWTTAFRREFEPFTNRVGFTWLNGLSFDQMLDKVADLPPRSFIFFILLLRDAMGVTHNADEALQRLRQVANAPINGIFEQQLGLGIVGGRLYRAEQEGVESARIAIRILHGEPATNFPPVLVDPQGTQYDWRELQRWKITEDRLPPGSVVKFRQPTLWARARKWIFLATAVVLSQTVLIFVLVVNLIRRNRAESSLRESEKRMKLAADAAELEIWDWNPLTNETWAIGPTPTRLIPTGSRGLEFGGLVDPVHPDDREAVRNALTRCVQGGGDYESVHRALLTDGETRWIAARGRMEFDDANKAMRMRGVSLDITIRKEIQDRAQESERRFLLMANSAPVLIWASGADKLCTFFNEPWLRFTGRTLEQEMGDGWTQSVHPHDLASCLKTYMESFEARSPFTMEYRLRRHDGQFRWVSDHGVPRYDPQGIFLGYIGSCVDVTQQKETETQLQETRRELAHVNRVFTLGELVGSLAHELNQPLAAILSNAQAGLRFMSEAHVNLEQVREILGDVAEESRRARDIIRRLRMMLNKGDVQMAPQEVNALVDMVIKLVRGELLLRNVAFKADLASGLPSIKGDRVQLGQVLLNLIMNASEAMGLNPVAERPLTLATRQLTAEDVEVSVGDEGPGFSAEALQKIYQPFCTTKPHGLGIGLAICRSIITAHGGQLSVANKPGRGALVRFTLKVHDGRRP